ncbi:hypothetical protein EXE30_15300 [Acinetobacter halotolerans]|uniref:Uncharacterized protein n=1 Tax=Acinetobacter halotolerans TaxID=1752076 RepID=A0A4Q6XER7_9GAMM|nr:hypothetical protein [Acinetobacter halotolerans]RZF49561.1 hypothetical protein EXE30_15300 [Acinetobacter halotolerans]
MKIYEMIFQKGLDERISIFCESNSISSRRYFIQLMREEIDLELKNFKDSRVDGSSSDMLFLFEEIYKESHFHLDVMEDFFIEKGIAKFCENVFLGVEERKVFRVEE